MTANKTETGTTIEGMNKEILAIKEKIHVSPATEVKAESKHVEANASLASNDDLINMKKEAEETKTNLIKLKENVQNVVKKIKEEMSTNKTEMLTELD